MTQAKLQSRDRSIPLEMALTEIQDRIKDGKQLAICADKAPFARALRTACYRYEILLRNPPLEGWGAMRDIANWATSSQRSGSDNVWFFILSPLKV